MLPIRALKHVDDHLMSTGVRSSPVKWRSITFAKDTTLSTLFSNTECALLAQLRANQPGALAENDPEFLHQMRVTVRRLRAILSLCSGLLGRRDRKAASRDLKWLARALGPARDSEVFVSEIWPPLRDALDDSVWIHRLEAQWLAQERHNARKAHRALASRRYQRMMIKLETWFFAQSWRNHADATRRASWDGPAQAFARQALQRRALHMGRYGRVLGDFDVDTLHRLRIETKKQRYIMDAVGPLFKQARVKRMLGALANLQDVLGAMNDIAVAEQKIGVSLPEGNQADLIQLRRQITAWQALRTKVLKRKLQGAWRTYRHLKPFW